MKIIYQNTIQKRLDKFLTEKFTNKTRTYLQKIIKSGKIKINNKTINTPHHLIKHNDLISIKFPAAKPAKNQPKKIPLNIIYEDKNLIIINKEAGISVHPTENNMEENTIVNAILNHCKDLSGIGGILRPGIVHRLDKDTSGLLIIAKNDKTHLYLSRLMENRKIEKKYIALIQGNNLPKKGTIEAPIIRDPKDRKKMSISASKKAKYALTHYKILRTFKNSSLISIQIITGRTHQIRVHFSSIGYPVIGDQKYGNKKTNLEFKKLGLKRQFLHAKTLKFKLPDSNKSQKFETELPEELKSILEKI